MVCYGHGTRPLRFRMPIVNGRPETILKIFSCSNNPPAKTAFHPPLASGRRITFKQGDVFLSAGGLRNAAEFVWMNVKANAVHLRVSTDDQSLDSQRDSLAAVCRQRGWTDVQVYEDKASGADTSRASLARLIADVPR